MRRHISTGKEAQRIAPTLIYLNDLFKGDMKILVEECHGKKISVVVTLSL